MRRAWLILGLVSAIAACSDSSGDTASAPASAAASGSGGSGGVTSASVGGSATSGSVASSASSSGSGIGGAPMGDPLVSSLVQSTLYVNCQPGIGADPVEGAFTADYDNTAGVADGVSAIDRARLIFEDNAQTVMLTWRFDTVPSHSGLVSPGNTAQVTHTKVTGSANGTGDGAPCDYCGGVYSLEVRWQTGIGGGMPSDTLSLGGVNCLF